MRVKNVLFFCFYFCLFDKSIFMLFLLIIEENEPPWVGIQEFTEYCIKNERKHRIKEIHIADGVVGGGGVSFPRNITFDCNLLKGVCIF